MLPPVCIVSQGYGHRFEQTAQDSLSGKLVGKGPSEGRKERRTNFGLLPLLLVGWGS